MEYFCFINDAFFNEIAKVVVVLKLNADLIHHHHYAKVPQVMRPVSGISQSFFHAPLKSFQNPLLSSVILSHPSTSQCQNQEKLYQQVWGYTGGRMANWARPHIHGRPQI